MKDNNNKIVWAVVIGTFLLIVTGASEAFPSSLLGFGVFLSWVVGVSRLFRGQNTSLGVLACIVPFVFIAGYLALPRPGSSLYIKQTDEQQRRADLRWPVEAAAYRQAVDYLKTEEQRRREVIERAARMEIDRDIPPQYPA